MVGISSNRYVRLPGVLPQRGTTGGSVVAACIGRALLLKFGPPSSLTGGNDAVFLKPMVNSPLIRPAIYWGKRGIGGGGVP